MFATLESGVHENTFSLKNALLSLENYPDFSWNFLCGQRYRLEDTKRSALDISDFRN